MGTEETKADIEKSVRTELLKSKEERQAEKRWEREYAGALFRKYGFRAIEVVVGIMEDPDAHEMVRLQAARAILDRAFGVPKQSVELDVQTTQLAPAPLLNDPAMRAALVGIHELLERSAGGIEPQVIALPDEDEQSELEEAIGLLPAGQPLAPQEQAS